MALPLMRNFPENYDYEKGYANVDMFMSREEAEQQSTQYPNMSFLGSGKDGLAVEVGNNTVIKYVPSGAEASNYERAMAYGLSCIPKIYNVQPLNMKNNVFAITMEKVRPLNPLEKAVVYGTWAFHASDIFEIPPEMVLEDLNEAYTDNYEYYSKEYAQGIEDVFESERNPAIRKTILNIIQKYQQMADCLLNNDFTLNDAHDDNIGWNSIGDMVLFDLGRSDRNFKVVGSEGMNVTNYRD